MIVTEFSGLAESSVFVVEFQQGVSKFEKMGELKLGEDGLIKIESEEKPY